MPITSQLAALSQSRDLCHRDDTHAKASSRTPAPKPRPPVQSLSPCSTRAIRCIATVVARLRTAARSPGSREDRVSDRTACSRALPPISDREADEPDRLLLRAAAGPAMPVMPTPTEASKLLGRPPRAPGDLGRDRADALDQLRVDAREIRLGPVASRRRRRRGRIPTIPGGRSGERRAGRRCTTRRPRSSRALRAAPRPARRSSSRRARTACSPCRSAMNASSASYRLLRRRLEARRDLDLAAPQAGRDLEPREPQRRRRPRRAACWRSPTRGCPNSRTISRAVRGRAGDRRLERSVGDGRLPHRLQLARAARAAPRRSGPAPASAGGTTSPGAVPTGLEHGRPAGITACLRLAARSASAVESGPAAHQRREDLARSAPRARRRAPSRVRRSRRRSPRSDRRPSARGRRW